MKIDFCHIFEIFCKDFQILIVLEMSAILIVFRILFFGVVGKIRSVWITDSTEKNIKKRGKFKFEPAPSAAKSFSDRYRCVSCLVRKTNHVIILCCDVNSTFDVQ